MAFSDESARIIARLDAQLAHLGDMHLRAQAGRWADAWDDVAPELLSALDELTADGARPTRAQLIRARRLTNALALVEARLAILLDVSAADAIADLRRFVDMAGQATDALVSASLPAGENVNAWARVDAARVDAIVTRAGEQITKLSYPLASDATATMKRELVRGMLVGANPRETARRMVAKSERIFNGGLSRALTIARTEQLDAHRAGAALAERQNADTLAGWTWVATLGDRTCPACWSMHGTEHDLSDPGPLGHQNCRCARVPRTKTWRELGFDIDEPASVLPDNEDAFNTLPAVDQKQILGPKRYDAWKSGDYPMSDWAKRQQNDGWRDSFNVSPAPALP